MSPNFRTFPTPQYAVYPTNQQLLIMETKSKCGRGCVNSYDQLLQLGLRLGSVTVANLVCRTSPDRNPTKLRRTTPSAAIFVTLTLASSWFPAIETVDKNLAARLYGLETSEVDRLIDPPVRQERYLIQKFQVCESRGRDDDWGRLGRN